jgi:hypothetical protein
MSFRVFYVCALLLAGAYLRDYVALRWRGALARRDPFEMPAGAGGARSVAYDGARARPRRSS